MTTLHIAPVAPSPSFAPVSRTVVRSRWIQSPDCTVYAPSEMLAPTEELSSTWNSGSDASGHPVVMAYDYKISISQAVVSGVLLGVFMFMLMAIAQY